MIRLRKWVVNADDFGYSKAVNYGILDAHKYGIVTSATLMANMPGAFHAAQLAKECKELGVGIHLVLTCGSPVRDDVPSLVNSEGTFHKLSDIEKHASLEDVKKELTSQIELFYSLGLTPTHLDSHHHIHTMKSFYPIVKELAETYQLPNRSAGNADRKLHPIEYLCADFYGSHLTVENTLTLFESLLDFETVEIMSHPSFIDNALSAGSSYSKERLNELDILTDPSIASFFEEKNIQLINYKDFANQIKSGRNE